MQHLRMHRTVAIGNLAVFIMAEAGVVGACAAVVGACAAVVGACAAVIAMSLVAIEIRLQSSVVQTWPLLVQLMSGVQTMPTEAILFMCL